MGHYTTEDLVQLFKLPSKYTVEDIEFKAETLQQELFREAIPLETKVEIQEFLKGARDLIKRDWVKPEMQFNDVIPRPNIPYLPTHVEEHTKGDINPYKKQTVHQLITIDTLYRPNFETTRPSNFKQPVEAERNAVSMELESFAAPCRKYPTFSSTMLSNTLTFTVEDLVTTWYALTFTYRNSSVAYYFSVTGIVINNFYSYNNLDVNILQPTTLPAPFTRPRPTDNHFEYLFFSFAGTTILDPFLGSLFYGPDTTPYFFLTSISGQNTIQDIQGRTSISNDLSIVVIPGPPEPPSILWYSITFNIVDPGIDIDVTYVFSVLGSTVTAMYNNDNDQVDVLTDVPTFPSHPGDALVFPDENKFSSAGTDIMDEYLKQQFPDPNQSPYFNIKNPSGSRNLIVDLVSDWGVNGGNIVPIDPPTRSTSNAKRPLPKKNKAILTLTIPDGDYSPDEFQIVMNTLLLDAAVGLKMRYYNGRIVFYTEYPANPLNYTLSFGTVVPQSAGAKMGFKLPSYTSVDTFDVLNGDGDVIKSFESYVAAEGYLRNEKCHFFFLEVEDYQNNHTINGVVTNISSKPGSNLLTRIDIRDDRVVIAPNKRDYLGPVRIENLNIRLLDRHGEEVTWIYNYSFALKLSIVYS